MTAAAERAGTALIVGHTHAFDPPAVLMGKLIRGGEFGRLRTIVNLVYTSFLYRPRRPEELDSSRGGGIMYNQVPHQLEIVQTLATAPLQSVRAVTGAWDPQRRTEGALAAFLTFTDGAVAQLTYSGYDHFDSDELHYWIDESGEEKAHDRHGATRRALSGVTDPEEERKLRTAGGYAGSGAQRARGKMHESHFGFLLASCERADLRPAPDGVTIYADDGVREIACPPVRVYPNKDPVIDELYAAVVDGVPPVHDGRWGTATMTAALALVESARTGREVAVQPA
jgi:phthalate 4,5-cis-dihydrodiol dehydrogenase